jgi:DNA-binding NarL/FixJ family response regulator
MKKRVLLINDHAMFRWGLGRFIANLQGFELACEAACGVASLQCLQQCKIDIVLLDLDMPGVDGVSLLAQIKALEVKKPRIIILTQAWDDLIGRKLQALGIDGYVLKSENITEISRALAAMESEAPYFSPGVARRIWDLLSETDPPESHPLTAREMKVAQLIGQGLSNREIAERLDCAANTVKTHRANLMRKIGVRNLVELTTWLSSL